MTARSIMPIVNNTGDPITDAMVEAGAEAFRLAHQNSCYPEAMPFECDAAAEAIYRAMQSAAQPDADVAERAFREGFYAGRCGTPATDEGDCEEAWCNSRCRIPAQSAQLNREVAAMREAVEAMANEALANADEYHRRGRPSFSVEWGNFSRKLRATLSPKEPGQ